MKNSISLACFLLMATAIFAQKNTLKVHIGGLPTNTAVFSMGLGYERMVAKTWSAQLMINLFGWSEGAHDGQGEVTRNAVLETRRYLGMKSGDASNKFFFVGCFVEAFRKNVLPGGETSEAPSPIVGKRWGIGTGLVLGKKFPLFKTFTFECFAGAKLRFVQSEDYIGNAVHYETYNAHQYTKITPRLGCNIGFTF